jgi:two-component system, cell cycle sensor histidine kinase and response regulator CckA
MKKSAELSRQGKEKRAMDMSVTKQRKIPATRLKGKRRHAKGRKRARAVRADAALMSRIPNRRSAKQGIVRLTEQLARAQKMESLGMIAGGLAHDFNNFLEVILGFASLARLRLPPHEEFQEPVRMIEEAARRAADLATQLLELTREGSGDLEPSDPSEALRRILKIIRRTFDRKIRIESRLEPGLPWIRTGHQPLEQAILNLAINARDAMPEGGMLFIGASRRTVSSGESRATGSSGPGDYVQITIEDNGVGMEPEILPHIFQPLFTTKPEGEGTGLGLAMVKKTVEESGGFIEVKSRAGRGSQFQLFFPIAPAHAAAASAAAPAASRGHGTILVVDDEPMVRSFVQKGLKQLGYNVLAAENGMKACEIYAAHAGRIACVLLDMVMPEISGLETFDRLRQLDPAARIILSSGYSRNSLGTDASSADFLSKPYTIESLSVAIRKAREA